MLSVGLFGFGHWGPNLARCVSQSPALTLKAVSDPAGERLAAAAAAYPAVRHESKPDFLSRDPSIDAVVLATPATTHFEMARKALRAGKHVLVEKPIALNSDDVLRLAEEADRRRLVLMVDHTYLYSPAVRAMRRIVRSGELGTIRHLKSVRVNCWGGRNYGVNVLWDLAIHDLSIIDYVFGRNLNMACVTGARRGDAGSESAAELSLHFAGGLAADIYVNWSGSEKVRRIMVTGSRKTLTFDDLKPSAKIGIVDKASRAAVMTPMEEGEPLRAVVDHFAACIIGGMRPLTDAANGHRVVQWLEAAEQSRACGRCHETGVEEAVR